MGLLLCCPSCGEELTLKAKRWKKQGNKSHLNLSWGWDCLSSVLLSAQNAERITPGHRESKSTAPF